MNIVTQYQVMLTIKIYIKHVLYYTKNYNPIPVPNAFTPNDDGLNDEFKPLFSIVNEYKMLIFNKYGEKIFESDDINRGWNGIYKGKIVQESYVYKISFTKDDNKVNMIGKFIFN